MLIIRVNIITEECTFYTERYGVIRFFPLWPKYTCANDGWRFTFMHRFENMIENMKIWTKPNFNGFQLSPNKAMLLALFAWSHIIHMWDIMLGLRSYEEKKALNAGLISSQRTGYICLILNMPSVSYQSHATRWW